MNASMAAALAVAVFGAVPPTAAFAQGSENERVSYMSFAQGALPLRIGGNPASRATFEHAVKLIDGSAARFTYTSLVDARIPVEFVYALPAPTTFDRFAVPALPETPSPSQTFARNVTVLGSAESADAGYVTLATGTLAPSSGNGQTTELTIERSPPVRWIKLVLENGIDVPRAEVVLEFSELIGNGTQEPLGDPQSFADGWRGRGVANILRQDGVTVSGCYDRTGDLQGTVTGPVLRATGIDRDDGVQSAFIAVVDGNGKMLGLRSTNGAPFRLFEAELTSDTSSLTCREPAPPKLGCGAIIHGVQFAYDSAEITRESMPVIAKLYDGLRSETAGAIAIEGHTSSEGTEAYNQSLSERRARAVVAALQARGLTAARLSATGLGETRPIASNDDESGRSLNRRVEVHCREP